MSSVFNSRRLFEAALLLLCTLWLSGCSQGVVATDSPAGSKIGLGGVPPSSATARSEYAFTPVLSNDSGVAVVFSIQGKPTWANFNEQTGALTGTPQDADVGVDADITIKVASSADSASIGPFSITVSPASVDTGISISGTPPAAVRAGENYRFVPAVTNAAANSTLTFTVSNLPPWASFDSATGILTGTPTAGQAGTYSGISISVTDGASSASLPPFAILVSAVNHAPTIVGSPSSRVTSGQVYSFDPTGSDPDGDSITYSISNKPIWANFDVTTGALSGTPSAADVGSTSNIVISVSDGSLSASLPAFTLTVTKQVVSDGSPIIAYTDLVAGPISGGENNLGAYVSIFGKNFGSDLSQVHVYFGNTEAAAYRFFGVSKGRSDIQQITVQPGPIGSGSLPVKVVVNGVSSNTDQFFSVQPGDVLFVDNVAGNDSSAVKNDINHPWRTVQTASEGGALSVVKPGDVIVLRGKAVWSDVGFESRWFRFRHATGTRPDGSKGSGYITIEAYPNENVHYVPPSGTSGGIHGVGENYPQFSDWIVIAGLHIESVAGSESDGAPVNLQVKSDHWRVVNNELGPWPASAGAGDKAGGLVGNGTDVKVFGNHIHDIGGGTENHGIYLDTAATNVEIAYNDIHDVVSGNLIQTYDNLGLGNIAGLEIHHNLIHDGGRYGMNIADGTVSVRAWNNIIYNTVYAGIRINQDERASVSEIFENNTLVNVCTNHPAEPGAIQNTWNATQGSIVFRNNIVVKTRAACPDGYSNSAMDDSISLSRNLWFGYSVDPKDAQAITSDPAFVAPASDDFHLSNGSPAIDMSLNSSSVDDFDLRTRNSPDLGALEK
jgi:hypothetical protein